MADTEKPPCNNHPTSSTEAENNPINQPTTKKRIHHQPSPHARPTPTSSLLLRFIIRPVHSLPAYSSIHLSSSGSIVLPSLYRAIYILSRSWMTSAWKRRTCHPAKGDWRIVCVDLSWTIRGIRRGGGESTWKCGEVGLCSFFFPLSTHEGWLFSKSAKKKCSWVAGLVSVAGDEFLGFFSVWCECAWFGNYYLHSWSW